MTTDELTLDTGTLRLAARGHGPRDGAPVLALHGWLDNAASFDALAPGLQGVRLVALDLPGHGHSDHRPPGPGYYMTEYAANVVAAADALGWRRFSLIGHSLGGSVAALVAATCPKRVERLALIESLGPLSERAEEAPRRLGRAIARSTSSGNRPPRRYASLDEAVEARRAVGGLSTAAARRLVERAIVADEAGLRWRSDPRLRWPTPFRFTEEQVLAILAAIHAPTLLIAATEGYLPPDDPAANRRFGTLPNARVQRLAGRHHLHLEDPGPVAALLSPFLSAA